MQMAGVEVHANILDTLLRHQEIADPFASYERLLVLCLIVSSLAALVLYRLDGLMSFVILIGSTGAFLTSAFVSLSQFYLRLPVVPPALSLVGVYATTAAYRFALVQRERRLIKRAFQHYVAPAIVERMLSDPSKLRLGGEEYEVSVLFSDLQGFTGIAEQLTPQQLRARLGSYFKDMMDVALAEQATLDKFIGDAIMLYFGCPVPDPAHPLQACRAALAMQRQLRKHNQEWRNYGAPELAMRIGINTGPVVAGNLGTDTIFNFTIIGDCVNLASRLEGANKEYGTFTIISEDTWCRVKGEFEARELDLIRVKGKVQPVRIYELAGFCAELSQQRKALHASFAEGLNFYRQQRWNEALSAFQGALEVDAHDGPSKTFIRRCEYYARTPRIEDWDFVHTMHVK
jgi:adenylate cyclase